jgi:hypothetical protein
VTITPDYSSKYTGDHGPFKVEPWATYDDGATREKVGRKSRLDGDEPAAIEVDEQPRPSRTNG